MNHVFLQLGSNMGNSKIQIMKAQQLIIEHIGKIIDSSSLYVTAAWGLEKQPDFLNQVIEVKTSHIASTVIRKVLEIEDTMGRVRNELYGPRIIDIDVLFFNSEILNLRNLTVPHPLLDQRRFVLTPLAELIPKFVHPVLQKTIKQLLKECDDTLNVQKI
jgi:2-amino-4-hydroxy-6-hydroxymethyldihydropteridine diphosphokinase